MQNLSEEFVTLTTRLMLAHERAEVLRITADMNTAILRLAEMEKTGHYTPPEKTISETLKFTHKEISKMSKTFKKEFVANGLVAHVTKRISGKRTYCYEIRYRSNGYNITASSTDLATAKAKFIERTLPENINKYHIQIRNTGTNLLEEVFAEWYNYKKGTITEKELNRFNVNFQSLPEHIRKKPIYNVRTGDIDNLMKEVKPRKYEELRTLFNGIFKYAVASGIIQHNPVALIKFVKAERQTRDALTEEEIYAFLENVKQPEYEAIRQGAYLLYFFGLRPCEVDQETHCEGDFLIARNRKRKNGKIEYKKIPIPLQAQGLIDWNKPLVFNCSDWKRNELFKKLLGDGDRTAYCLRHTFSTICQEYLKRPDIVDIWMGDSPQRLVGKVYTHFSDKFMRAQMDTVIFPTLKSLNT
jgi:integrase